MNQTSEIKSITKEILCYQLALLAEESKRVANLDNNNLAELSEAIVKICACLNQYLS